MSEIDQLPRLDHEAGMLVEPRDEAVICTLTLALGSVIGAIF